ncbi:carbohydrate-binding protein [Streptomyces sp. NEAU-H22]|uniref:glycoside hydrolase family 30 beta sandwich domain-containing protein n=1 Tax=Streptomyces sp. NEAU-H22 TaxID=2994655 RepID=UPI00224DB305|nr:carbohydrate-binding protein [Streptomyces sp. NEAU-H22]
MKSRLLAVVAAMTTAVAGTAAIEPPAPAAATVTVNGSTEYQKIDGFGFSEFFGRSAIMRGSQGLSAQKQQEVLDLLLSRSTGAGLSILRLGIASGSGSIQPVNPGGPNATPRYVWNGNDDGQVWLAQQAKAYGVNRFYADAWSAPGYMKTNGSDTNGGTLCGLSGASCAGGDWRRAYANYLVQFAKFYAQEGIAITDLGFTNEPNWTTDYSSMRLTPAQAVEFSRLLGPLADANGLKMACCDVVGWDGQKTYTHAIEADSTARGLVDLHTGHSYGSYPSTPLPTLKPTWMSEWSPDGTTWNEAWDDGSGYDGYRVAHEIHTALTGGNVNAYVYWYGASTGATRGFIQLDGDAYRVSKRLWAMASYSRFIRPGATRIAASTSDRNLRMSSFRNTDGTVVMVALNAATSANEVTFSLRNTGIGGGTATPYLTNGGNSMTAQPALAVTDGSLTATVPARSAVTYVVRGSDSASRYEAESAPAVCGGTIDADWPGYSGTGFCNGDNAAGALAQFTVNAADAGTATIAVRFANGATTARPADLVVNGTRVQQVSFEGTGTWSRWISKTLTVNVGEGSNIIRFNPTGAGGLPNLDYVELASG